MDVALLIVGLVVAGQNQWTPDRYGAAAAGPTSTYDRYAQPPGGARSGVQPPPSVIDRAQRAATETGTTLRDGFEAGMQAANEQFSRNGEQLRDATRNANQEISEQLQDWTSDAGRRLQSAGDDLRSATQKTLGLTDHQPPPSPSSRGSMAPSPSTTTRGNVAPPPWPATSATTAPLWSPELPTAGEPATADIPTSPPRLGGPTNDTDITPVDPTASPGMVPTRTAHGWTSIGTSVAAPPLLIPSPPASISEAATMRTASTDTVRQSLPAATAGRTAERDRYGAAPGELRRQPNTTPANDANNWASDWDTRTNTASGAVGRQGTGPSLGNPVGDSDLVPIEKPNTAAPPAQSHPAQSQSARSQRAATEGTQEHSHDHRNGWSDDPWGEADPWNRPLQTSPAAPASQMLERNSAATGTTDDGWPDSDSPAATNINPASQQAAGTTSGGQSIAGRTGGRLANIATQPPSRATAAGGTAGEQPPWMPLLVVSLSLVGSLSANLFLGWSYMDARQKYQSLVRKTADTFRRAASAA